MAHGIWATWYDLPPTARAEYLAWLETDHLPALQADGRFSWVAHYDSDGGGGSAMRRVRNDIIQRPREDVGQGSQYLLVAGVAAQEILFDPLVLSQEREAIGTTREMLSRRQGSRPTIFIEQMRVDGPAGPIATDGLPAPAIQMGSFRVRSIEEEFDLNCWYAQYRMPFMARTPGSVGARKLACVAGWPKHAILYEFTSLEARLKEFEEPHEALALDSQEWTGRIVRYTIHSPGSPMVARRTWPPFSAASA
jgi:hypothetical protein